MEKILFKGCVTALITPMDEQGMIDFDSFSKLLDYQLIHGIDGVLVNGTSGESATLEEEEAMKLIDFTVKYVNHRVPVIAGTGSNCTTHAIRLSKKAEALGVDGLLVVTPYYNKASQDGLIKHFLSVANAISIPMLLYNIPTRTGVAIHPETCLTLSHHPNIYGLKEAGGNISMTAKIAALCKDSLAIYSGNDDQTVPILSLGGKGVISVLSNIMPKEMCQMCHTFFHGEWEKSSQLQLELLDLINALFLDVNPIPIKAALSAIGLCKECYRLPLTKMNDKEREILFQAMAQHLLPIR